MRFALAAALVGLLVTPLAQASAEPLDGDAIRTLFADNTVTGVSTGGRSFSEFHRADGRLYGNNGYYTNTDACWTTRPDAVCYYYGEGDARSVHCFSVARQGNELTLTLAKPSPRAGTLDATARVEPGNPHGFGDGGRAWVCDGLISRKHEPIRKRVARWH